MKTTQIVKEPFCFIPSYSRPKNNQSLAPSEIDGISQKDSKKPINLRLRRNKDNMGRGRKQIFLGIGLVMLMGLAIYLRLWTIDYNFSSSETELLRRQFDLASREAMDESAMWRKRYDDEEKKSSACQKELIKIKQLLKQDGAAGMKKKVDLLQKENIDLLERVESLKQELESEKLKCSMKQI